MATAEMLAIFFVLLLPFLYETSHVFRYYFKFLLYYVVVSSFAVFLIPVMLFNARDVTNLITASHFCRHVSTLLGLKWHIRGREILEKECACVIVANHQSSLDVLGMFDLWPVMGKCTVVAKRQILYVQPFGLAAWLAGLVFIDRHIELARTKLDAAAEHIKTEKIKLWVFPEGTRRSTGEIHNFKKGAFHIAVNAQLPIMPVVITSYQNYLNSKNKIFNSGNIIVTALEPIPTIGLTVDDIPELMERTRNLMIETFKVANKEIEVMEGKKNMNKKMNVNEENDNAKNEEKNKDDIVKQKIQILKTVKA